MDDRRLARLFEQEAVVAVRGVDHVKLDRLAELEVLTPDAEGYSPSDLRIVEAISRFRAGGYEERIGFTVYDTHRYRDAMGALVK